MSDAQSEFLKSHHWGKTDPRHEHLEVALSGVCPLGDMAIQIKAS